MLTHEQKLERQSLIEGYLRKGSSKWAAITNAAIDLELNYEGLRTWARREEEAETSYAIDWTLESDDQLAVDEPDASEILSTVTTKEYPDCRCFIFTAAQDSTAVDMPFFNNLLAYAKYKNAQLVIGGFTYQKGLFEDHKVTTAAFAPELYPYLNPNIVEIGKRMMWYGRANIVPTKSNPLAGWDTHGHFRSLVIPHARIALKSVATASGQTRKQIMSSGVLTQPNYVQREAGQKAEFHHTIGATIVELNPLGEHFARQIHAEEDGSFYDLTYRVENEKITGGHSVEAITWGDAHRYVMDRNVALGSWGFDTDIDQIVNSSNMLDVLKPRLQFFHDSFDFYSRSHHTRHDPFERQRRLGKSIDEVEYEIKQCADFLAACRREFSTSVHVGSNHNLHFERWVKDTTVPGTDHVNSIYWAKMFALYMSAARADDPDFILHEAALRLSQSDHLEQIMFLKEGESFKICDKNIECGFHGHKGPNGAFGSVVNLSRIVDRVNIADKHSPAIREGLYCAGTSSKLELDYNTSGPGSWDHTHIVTYKNAMRTLVTFNEDRWHA